MIKSGGINALFGFCNQSIKFILGAYCLSIGHQTLIRQPISSSVLMSSGFDVHCGQGEKIKSNDRFLCVCKKDIDTWHTDANNMKKKKNCIGD